MDHSPRRNILLFSLSCILESAHFVSPSKWTLEHILPSLTLFYYILHASILEGEFHVNILHVHLVLMPILVVHPLLETFEVISFLFLDESKFLLRDLCPLIVTWSTME
jgi:hypothetical protein